MILLWTLVFVTMQSHLLMSMSLHYNPPCVLGKWWWRYDCLTTDEVHKVVLESNKLLKTQVSAIRGSLVLYLANEETEHILFRPVKVKWVLCTIRRIILLCQYYVSGQVISALLLLHCIWPILRMELCLFQASILQTHEALEKIIMQHYCTEDQYIISCPSQDQVR